MSNLRIWITVIAVLVIASERLPAQNRPRIATGILKSVAAGRIEITLSANYGPGLTQGSLLSVTVPAGMPVKPHTKFVSEQSLTVADLAPGDEVMVRFTGSAGAYTATAITLLSIRGMPSGGTRR